jgi:hypothetical protein
LVRSFSGHFLVVKCPGLGEPWHSDRFAGGFMTVYGVISVKIKQSWYLGEARTLLATLCITVGARLTLMASTCHGVWNYPWTSIGKILRLREMGCCRGGSDRGHCTGKSDLSICTVSSISQLYRASCGLSSACNS